MVQKVAEVRGGVVVARHVWPDSANIATHKISTDGGPIFRPYIDPGMPAYDPLTQKVNMSENITQSSVTAVYQVVSKTVQEIALDKDAAMVNLNGSMHQALKKAIQMLANDNRRIKRKVNDIIAQQGISAQVPPFPAAQTTSPTNDLTVQQVVDLVRAQLDV